MNVMQVGVGDEATAAFKRGRRMAELAASLH